VTRFSLIAERDAMLMNEGGGEGDRVMWMEEKAR